MQPDLPEGYYLENVVTLFNHVESLYADILDHQHLDFLRSFAALPSDTQKLYIRLLNRNRHLFRLSKLDYPEIASIEDAIQLLNVSGFLQVDPRQAVRSSWPCSAKQNYSHCILINPNWVNSNARHSIQRYWNRMKMPFLTALRKVIVCYRSSKKTATGFARCCFSAT